MADFAQFNDGNSFENVNIRDKDDGSIGVKVDSQGNLYTNLRNSSGVAVTTTTSQDKTRLDVSSEFKDDGTLDAFQRLRVTSLATITAFDHSISDLPLLFENSLTGSGTSTLNITTASMDLTTTTTNGDSVIRQSKRYVRYAPGRSYYCTFALNPGGTKTNVRRRWGYFDASDGIFFELDTTIKVVVRSSTTGSIVDTSVSQSSWNLDKLDGTGPSGITLDLTKHNVFVIDFAWHGGSRIRWGVNLNGKNIYVHEYTSGNIIIHPHTRSGSRPMRFEITNTGTAASSTTMKVTAGSISKESLDELAPTFVRTISNGATSISPSSSSPSPILAIRPKTTFKGIVNRTPIVPTDATIITNGNIIYFQIIFNATITGGTWTSVATESAVEYNSTITSYTGGEIYYEDYLPSNGISERLDLSQFISDFVLGVNIAGTSSDNILITAQRLAGNASVYSSIAWQEFQ